MDRRTFLAGTSAVLLGAPLAAEGQQAKPMARVGILSPIVPTSRTALGKQLRELGWVEGRTLVFEDRFADGQPERLPDLARGLVRLRVNVIVAVSPPAIRAAKDATQTIPIVMAFSGIDPVKAGFVASLSRPGGNVTGLTLLATEMTIKRLELVKEALRCSITGNLWSLAASSPTAQALLT
jgi:putative ABC transport system substrate-binding protein